MRNLARRLGVVVVTMFVWSTLLTMVPPSAQAAMPMHDSAMSSPMMDHSTAHSSSQQQIGHHGDGACCLAGQHCTGNCLLPLLAIHDLPVAVAAEEVPLPLLAVQAPNRPPQPPRRPPKA